MTIIGLTGSLASGKTTASKIIAAKRGPLFNADKVVKRLYNQKKFRRHLSKKLNLNLDKDFKENLRNKVLKKKKILRKLEKIIHPLIRKEMHIFLKKNKKKKFLFLEIPLLIESKLVKYFDVIIFIKSSKNLRLKRFMSRGGRPDLFSLLDKHQIKDSKKMKFCDHIVVNNRSLSILKNKLYNIIYLYE